MAWQLWATLPHSSGVYAVAISRDGLTLLSGSGKSMAVIQLAPILSIYLSTYVHLSSFHDSLSRRITFFSPFIIVTLFISN